MQYNIYRPQRSCGQGNIFTPVCHSFCSQGGCLPQCMLGYHTPPQDQTPPDQTPLRTRPLGPDTPQDWTPHPRTRHPPRTKCSPLGLSTPPTPGRRLRHMVNEWPVRILLECILQGGHGTGKTGNLVLTFSRQGKHREFCFDTGKNSETQGKYFSVTQGNI